MDSNNYTNDPMQVVNNSHITNQSYTSMLVDAPSYDVIKHHYDVAKYQFNSSGISHLTAASNSHHVCLLLLTAV